MASWVDKPRDFWKIEGNRVVRHHVVPRTSLFSPAWTRCPVSLDQLSSARLTKATFVEVDTKDFYTPNWKNPLEAHRDLERPWTGSTTFYLLEGHGPTDEDVDIDDIAAAFYAEPEEDQLEPVGPSEHDMDAVFTEPWSDSEDSEPTPESTCGLIHAAGYGIVDTGCGRGLVLHEVGHDIRELPEKLHTFRYGNGSSDQTSRRVEVPVFIGGKQLRVRLHVVPGDVPLLISKRLLKSVVATIDLNMNKLVMVHAGVSTDLHEMKDNSYQVNLLEMKPGGQLTSTEVDVLQVADVPGRSYTHSELVEIYASYEPGPDSDDPDPYDPEPYDDDLASGVCCVFKAKDRREVQNHMSDVLASHLHDAPTMVEFFSPNRFAEWTPKFGLIHRASFDLSDGWDWRDRQLRSQSEYALRVIEPDLTVLSPPCGPLSRLQNLTKDENRKDLSGHLLDVKHAQGMVKWSLGVAEFQIARGKEYVFESSQTSGAWSMPETEAFIAKYHPYIIDVPACAVGLIDPENKLPFGKKWRFMTGSRMIAMALGRFQCSGQHKHQPVEGSSGGMLRSVRSQVYPGRLIRTILGAFAMHEGAEHWCHAVSQASVQNQPHELRGEARRRVERAIMKMHVNLGHASKADMERILRHHHAQEPVLELVRSFECSICQARVAPKAVKDSAPPRDMAPLRYVGLDVKWLPSWKSGEKIKALNIVCRMSGLQQMYPFREQETSEVICRLYRNWTKSYGRPRYVKFDASRCNLGQHFLDQLERDGTVPLDVPGEAHEQMGDVESQGRHFEDASQRVLDQMQPQDYHQWLDCVDVTLEARNSLMRRAGHSPYQLVFGRDPEFPGDDLACNQPNPISNSAILEDAVAEYQHRARSVARQEMLQALDKRAARIALNARPRPLREFRPGDEVAVWRRGKGLKRSSARWRGPGIVAGSAGGNYWVSMPGSFIKCTPEQLRLRTSEEREADRFLVRDLRSAAAALWPEVGPSNRGSQKCFFDITAEDSPPGDLSHQPAQQVPDCRVEDVPQPVVNSGGEIASQSASSKTPHQSDPLSQSLSEKLSQLSDQDRSRWEESAMQADRLDGVPSREPPPVDEPSPEKRLRTEEPQSGGQRIAGQMFPPPLPMPDHVANMQVRDPYLVAVPSSGESIRSSSEKTSSAESGFLLTTSTTSMYHVVDSTVKAVSLSCVDSDEDFVLCAGSNSDHALLAGGRKEINLKEAKWKESKWKDCLMKGVAKEVNTVIRDKLALKPLSMAESREIRQNQAHRIVPSRMVLTLKQDESGCEVVKARWAARGDKDPDLFSLIREGATQAPTISSNGRYTVLQTIASHKFTLQLGDVTGAFLEADEMVRSNGRLFMAGPSNINLPGYESEQLFEVIKPIYGFNDSPQRWFGKFSKTVKGDGWVQSKLDHCVFYLWDNNTLAGCLGVHVDDVLLGGRGALFDASVERLRKAFPFRKWRHSRGEFCGADLIQCPDTFDITVSQKSFAMKLQKPKLRMKESPLVEVTPEESKALKSVLGGALWLAKETRPDLSVQVSQGQQLLPTPTLGDARTVCNVVRRAKQYQDLSWKILSIPFDQLRLCLHTDAAFANAKRQGTQAGYLVSVTDDGLRNGQPAPWSPCVWKSYRLKRVVGSTFAGESQVLSDGLGHAEWIACHLAEAKHKDFSLMHRSKFLVDFHLQSIVDCKSIYDHLQHFASPGSIGDKRVAIDLVIVRETLKRIGGVIRWAPTWLQLADALTKESPEAMDLLRAALTTHMYHLNEESQMMDAAANQRQIRVARKHLNEPKSDPAVAANEVASAQALQSTPVLFTRSFPRMVKVSTSGLSEGEVRSLFECMVSQCVSNADEYLTQMMQSKSMCRAKIPACEVHTKAFRGDESKITFVYTKTTKMIQIQGGAILLDKAEEMLKSVLKLYIALLRDGIVEPLPEGGKCWGRAIQESNAQGAFSGFLDEIKEGEVKTEEFEPKHAAFVPEDEKFAAAVADLCNEGARKLHEYPGWRNKFLQFMLCEFNASTDQVLTLSELSDQVPEEEGMQWSMAEESEVKSSRPKAKAGGYRGKSSGGQVNKEF